MAVKATLDNRRVLKGAKAITIMASVEGENVKAEAMELAALEGEAVYIVPAEEYERTAATVPEVLMQIKRSLALVDSVVADAIKNDNAEKDERQIEIPDGEEIGG